MQSVLDAQKERSQVHSHDFETYLKGTAEIGLGISRRQYIYQQ